MGPGGAVACADLDGSSNIQIAIVAIYRLISPLELSTLTQENYFSPVQPMICEE